MATPTKDCGSCRFMGEHAPWAFLIVAALISVSPLGPNWQKASAYLAVFALILLAGAYAIKRSFAET